MKDYKDWHAKKTIIENSEKPRLFFHEREIWWCSTGLNIGSEQDGKGQNFVRPIIIFKKFNNEFFWSIPLSTNIKTGRYYVPVNLKDKIIRVAIISQLRPMDSKRLVDKIGTIDQTEYSKIKKSIIELCAP